MPSPILAPALAALLALAAAPALASGFGRMSNATVLGQRLDISVPLQLDAGQTLDPECVSAEVYAGEFRVAPSAVHVTLAPGPGDNERLLHVVTQSVIDEPVVSVSLRVGCTNPMTRKYVAFVDPPAIAAARAEPPAAPPTALVSAAAVPPSTSSRAERVAAAAAAQASPDANEAPRAAQRSAKPKRSGTAKGAPRATARNSAPKSTTVAKARPRKAPAEPRVAAAAVAPVVKGPRLQLDAAAPDVLLAQTGMRLADALPLALPAVALAAQEAASAAQAELAAQGEKLAVLEASLARLRAESQATQASLATLQAQLREAESQRYANPLVYALIALCVVFGSAAVWLWRLRAAERRKLPQWWAPPTSAGVAAATQETEAVPASAPATPGPRAVHPDEWEAPDTSSGETTASPRLIEPEPAPGAPQSEATTEMSVEELIDLEQQAEFFVVLGQDEAAIDLLMGHLRSSGGASPLPYLKLLEIYRRRDDREAYERTRDRFNRRFNAYAPDWNADLQRGRSLEDYAHVVARLQSLWASPALAMRALEASLLRRDAAVSTFDLPAYRELLFLYSVARDLSEPRAEDSVDLLLPIDAQDSASATLTPLHPTRPMPIAADAYTTQVDVDITSLDAGPSSPDDRPSRYLSDFGTTSGDVHVPAERFAASR